MVATLFFLEILRAAARFRRAEKMERKYWNIKDKKKNGIGPSPKFPDPFQGPTPAYSRVLEQIDKREKEFEQAKQMYDQAIEETDRIQDDQARVARIREITRVYVKFISRPLDDDD